MTASSSHPRFDRLDALRGLAIVWMAVFHFCFDLAHFRLVDWNFRSDSFWTVQRTMIVSLFLFTAGLSQAVAQRQGLGWPRFWRRWVQIAACALLVSAGSALMFPRSFIYFGVLHGIAVMLILARLSGGWGRWLWLAGLVAVAAPQLVQIEALNGRALNWIGLVTRKPLTEDYVPLLPWMGLMWWGMATGQWLLQRRALWLQGRLPRLAAPLAVLGRWSLSFYMLHQPVLIGALMAAMWIAK